MDPIPRFGHMRKMKTVTQFGHILASWKIIPEALFGYVHHMASKSGPRVPKGYLRRLFWRVRGEYLRWEGPPQRRRRSGFGSDPEIRPHAKNEDSYTVWTHVGLLEYRFFDLFGVCI